MENHDLRVIVFLLPLILPHQHSVHFIRSLNFFILCLFFVSRSSLRRHQASDDRRHVWVPLPGERRHQNWELVETVDWQAFEERIRNVISGPAAMASASAAAKPAAKHFLILDGHIILNHKWVTHMPFPFSFFPPAFCSRCRDPAACGQNS